MPDRFYEPGTKITQECVSTRSLESCTALFENDDKAVALVEEKWLISSLRITNIIPS